jgi:hypothetical protein
MVRSLLLVGGFVLMVVGNVRAEEIKGTVKNVDSEKYTLVLTVTGEDKTFAVAKDVEIFTQAMGKKNKPGPKEPVAGGMTGLRVGSEVVVNVIKSGSKEVISSIKVEGKMKKKKDK